MSPTRREPTFDVPLDRAIRPTPTRSRSRPKAEAGPTQPRTYHDFVVALSRVDASTVTVRVRASPAGRLSRGVAVAFDAAEVAVLRESFVVGDMAGQGRALITRDEGLAIGRRLAEVLLPPQVFALLERSLSQAVRAGSGIRIRVVADGELIDLPWEYVVRPDRAAAGGLSSFLLFDPALSLVRLAPRSDLRLPRIDGPQRLNYIGTFWEGRVDRWEVWREFDQLRRGLLPMRRYLEPQFAVASDLDVFDEGIEAGTAIFHYAGHVDFDSRRRPVCIREMPSSAQLTDARVIGMGDVARALARAKTRLAVLSACNSGAWAAVKPLIGARVPAVIGINGSVLSLSAIEFFTQLYESLGLGLGLDEAVAEARRAAMDWGDKNGLFDWGLFMVYSQVEDPVLLPQPDTGTTKARQHAVRLKHEHSIASTVERVRALEGLNFGELISHSIAHRVLILGRFSARRLPILQAIQDHLARHSNQYLPALFTFKRPESRDLVESVLAMAGLCRFIVADLSEPRAVQQELQAIVPNFPSVPVVPIVSAGSRELSTFEALSRRPNVARPTVKYRSAEDLPVLLDREVIPRAETMYRALRPG